MRRLAPLALLLLAPASLRAQVRASEPASVSQTVDGTKVTIEYYRPMARGRDTLFGKQVPWGHTWTPGANWATTLEADKDIRLNGHPLPKGKYSVWMIARRDTSWTVVLSRAARRFHMQPPPAEDEQLRFDVRPEPAPMMEALSWYFPVFSPEGAALRMHWGTTFVPLKVSVEPSRPVTLSEADRKALVGAYVVRRGQTTDTLEVLEADDKLRARVSRPMFGYDPVFDLVPVAPGRFRPGFYQGGKPFEVEEFIFAFKTPRGGTPGVDMLGIEDRVLMHGDKVR
jgi:hypothetical protein